MILEEPSTTITDSDERIKTCLKEVFGFNQFRGEQEAIIRHILSGKNTFVLMPTGAGKSLCYQLPALVKEGTAIVISPLIALMKNQVDQLLANGINAQFLNSSLSKAELNRVKKDLLEGTVKLLYVAPESLTKEENLTLLQKVKISFFAIDEAHCISEWGHDFRPEYRRIKQIVDQIGNLPIIALTATATPKVQQDIQKNLNMEEAALFKGSFNRTNLYYEIRAKIDAKRQLIRFIKQNKSKSGIIYCLSRKKVEEIAEFLCVNDIKALPYHAGLDAAVRVHNQDAFLNEKVDVIVATIAFGMGIDKPDVRFVIHYDAPKSLEGYYQETGRGGRDGLEGYCLMFYAYEDILKLEKFNKDKTVTERDNARHLLDEMVDYTNSSVCRRRQLLNYFGEVYDKDCGFCDNCVKPSPKEQLEKEAVWVIQAVIGTEERFGIKHLVDVVAGVPNDYVKSYGHDKLEVYGKGSERTPEFWYSFIRQMMVFGFLEKDIENYGILKVGEKGHKFLSAPYKVTYSVNHDYSNAESDSDDEDGVRDIGAGQTADPVLKKLLDQLLEKEAKRHNIPKYAIFQEPQLNEMSIIYPTTMAGLCQITGVGQGKANKFGKAFLDLIFKYVEENDIEPITDVVIKSAVNKSNKKIDIIKLVDRKLNLDEVADQLGLSMEDLLSEIELIVFSGTKLNINYYVNDILDEDRQDDMFDYFMSAQDDDLEAALTELGNDYSDEEIRIMRIKFISDIAN